MDVKNTVKLRDIVLRGIGYMGRVRSCRNCRFFVEHINYEVNIITTCSLIDEIFKTEITVDPDSGICDYFEKEL